MSHFSHDPFKVNKRGPQTFLRAETFLEPGHEILTTLRLRIRGEYHVYIFDSLVVFYQSFTTVNNAWPGLGKEYLEGVLRVFRDDFYSSGTFNNFLDFRWYSILLISIILMVLEVF